MVSSFFIYALLERQGAPVVVSSYVAVVFGAAAVTVLEFVIPYDTAWQPDAGDVKNDLLFMVTVQMVLPQTLTLLAGVGMVRSATQLVRGITCRLLQRRQFLEFPEWIQDRGHTDVGIEPGVELWIWRRWVGGRRWWELVADERR